MRGLTWSSMGVLFVLWGTLTVTAACLPVASDGGGCIQTWTGTLGGLPVRVELLWNGEECHGVYSYVSRSRERLWLRGRLQQDGGVQLREYCPPQAESVWEPFPQPEEMDGVLGGEGTGLVVNGTLTITRASGDALRGHWEGAKRSGRLPVELSPGSWEEHLEGDGLACRVVRKDGGSGASVLQVIVDGEEPVVLLDGPCRNPDTDRYLPLESIRVSSLPGARGIVVLSWQEQVLLGQTTGSIFSVFRVFPRGRSQEPLVEGAHPLSRTYLGDNTDGDFHVGYERGAVVLTHHWTQYQEEEGGGKLTEEIVTRWYRQKGDAWGSAGGERRWRTASTPAGEEGGGEPDLYALLDGALWSKTVLSPEQAERMFPRP